MNNPDYTLTLEPLAFSMVNDDLAYEIGQCSGSYGGSTSSPGSEMRRGNGMCC